MSFQLQGPRPRLNLTAKCWGFRSNDSILVFIRNIPSRPQARSRWPGPNGLLALPNENQTLCCERVLRQETSIVRISGIGDTEPLVQDPSSPAQLPLQFCVDAQCSPAFETALRLKDLRNMRARVETESFYSGLDSEEFWFNGGRSHPRGRIHRVSKEEFQENELVPSDRRASRLSGWRNC
jgi:hypothetical protein